MTLIYDTKPFLSSTSQTVSMSQMISITPGTDNPKYLYLNATDSDCYTNGVHPTLGSFSGNGHMLQVVASSNDNFRQAGIAFTYDNANNGYFNATYGNLANVTFTTSSTLGDVTALSLFGRNSQPYTYSTAGNITDLIVGASYYHRDTLIGTTTALTTNTPPALVDSEHNATPQAIAAAAQTFVGQSWNVNGCQLLASSVAAQAGASLPVTSLYNVPGVGNGPWFAAYNGAFSAVDSSWMSQVRTGDIIAFHTNGTSAHITTCVSGWGPYAQVIDNANFGSNAIAGTSDITIYSQFQASYQFNGTDSQSVSIYRLDTPTVTANQATVWLGTDNLFDMGAAFTSADPHGTAITRYEITTGNASDIITCDGNVSAADAYGVVRVVSLSGTRLYEQATSGSDAIAVRAYNGSYWGDWANLSLVANGSGPAIVPPPPPPAPVLVVVAPILPPAVPTIIVPATIVAPAPAVSTPVVPPSVVPSPTPIVVATPPAPQPPVDHTTYRFFDTQHGTQFLTSSASERDALIAARPDLSFEGAAMGTVQADPSDANVLSVFRFFNLSDGTHFFTTDAGERDTVAATRTDLVQEQTNFFEHAAQRAGDAAVYRFFNANNGTHFYTQNSSEAAGLSGNRTDMINEGIAFYAPLS